MYAEGIAGDVISDMQQRLKAAGSLKGDIDGVYGGDTVKAVKDFQKSRGFPVIAIRMAHLQRFGRSAPGRRSL